MRTFGYIFATAALIGLAFVTVPNISSTNRTNKENDTHLQGAHGVQFQKITFAQALQKSKTENKLIFMNVYAVWCGPCKLLKDRTFQSDKVANLLNSNFINIDVDAEKGEGIELAQRYNVEAHPLMLLINSEGKVVKSILGYRKDNQLVDEVKDFVRK